MKISRLSLIPLSALLISQSAFITGADKQVFMIPATNSPEQLSPALQEAGRFGQLHQPQITAPAKDVFWQGYEGQRRVEEPNQLLRGELSPAEKLESVNMPSSAPAEMPNSAQQNAWRLLHNAQREMLDSDGLNNMKYSKALAVKIEKTSRDAFNNPATDDTELLVWERINQRSHALINYVNAKGKLIQGREAANANVKQASISDRLLDQTQAQLKASARVLKNPVSPVKHIAISEIRRIAGICAIALDKQGMNEQEEEAWNRIYQESSTLLRDANAIMEQEEKKD